MISWCVACYRPAYARLLIAELVRKTTVPFEVLLWLNTADRDFAAFIDQIQRSDHPVRVVGTSEENIGMAAYPRLFAAARFDMIAQIDDDVVAISRGIPQIAAQVFERFASVGMIAADVWQDEYTTGARPPMEHYQCFDSGLQLYTGPVDGWFAIYRRGCLDLLAGQPVGRYDFLGSRVSALLPHYGMAAVLCLRMKVFHVIGPAYASYFGQLDSEIAKYESLGRAEIVRWYTDSRPELPSREELDSRAGAIRQWFDEWEP